MSYYRVPKLNLAKDVENIIISLGFTPHKYRIFKKISAPFKYHVRISKDTQRFIDLIKLNKS
ncbi:MAG: hypothetical protein HYX20_01110 [Candidatus Yanofskybacteria bacterium]|nr:hypothetical protein [Candidatus Yanofskybacteria bacterium]